MTTKILGFISGLLNGLFGSGGGIAAVPMLESLDLPAKKAHATSVALIFFLSLITTILYFLNGNIDFAKTLWYIPGGVLGAIVGSVFLKKIDNSILRRIFGAIMIIFAVRIFIK